MNELNILKELLNMSGKENISSKINNCDCNFGSSFNISFQIPNNGLSDSIQKKTELIYHHLEKFLTGTLKISSFSISGKRVSLQVGFVETWSNPKLNINAKLGPNKQTNLGLNFNLGQNKGVKLNIGRSF